MVIHEGKLRILRIDKTTPADHQAIYWVMFFPYRASGGAIPRHICYGEENLRKALSDLGIEMFYIDQTMKDLEDKKDSCIDHVLLNNDQLRRYGLGELGVFDSIRTYIGSL